MPQLVLAFLAFATVVAVADIHGWGSGPTGVVYMLLWFLFASSWFGRRGWDRILFLMCLGSFFVAMIAIHQAFIAPRPHGLFRSANILGGYAAMHFAICCLARYRRTAAWNEVEIWFYIVTALLNALTVALSQSRGGMLALLAAILVIAGRRYPKIVSVVAVAVASAVVCWTLQRGLDDPRLVIWRAGLIAGLDRPWLGWGQGGLTIGFNGLQSLYNVTLEWFVAAGLCGLAAGLWLYITAIMAALQLRKGVVPVEAAADAQDRPVAMKAAGRAVLAVLAAFFVQGMFMFGTAATYLPLVTVLAWLASEQWGPRTAERSAGCRSRSRSQAIPEWSHSSQPGRLTTSPSRLSPFEQTPPPR
jgi:hypothetical protein